MRNKITLLLIISLLFIATLIGFTVVLQNNDSPPKNSEGISKEIIMDDITTSNENPEISDKNEAQSNSEQTDNSNISSETSTLDQTATPEDTDSTNEMIGNPDTTDVPDITIKDTEVPDTSMPETSAPETSVPDTSVPETSTPGPEAPKQEIPKNAVNIMSNISSVKSFLIPPSESDFGEDYDNAVKLYDAIIDNEEEKIVLNFNNLSEMERFVQLFEDKVLSNLFEIPVIFTHGARNNIQCSPKEIYEDVLIFNEYKKTILSLGINEYTTQKDAVVKINNWMINYLSYESMQNNPYKAYKNKTANCDAYAKLFKRFCKVIGVECTWEDGRVKTNGSYGLHAWNKVKLDNKWYYIDVCWNDSRRPNRYLLSSTLWDDHTSYIPIKINLPKDKAWGNKINFQNISNINYFLKEPTKEVFGVSYDAALAIYNAILNNEDEIKVQLFLEENTTIDAYELYSDFSDKFQKYVLSGAIELKYWGIHWNARDCDVSVRVNSAGIRKHLDMLVNSVNDYHNANIAAGVTSEMTEMEALAKIITWMSYNLNYDNYAYDNSLDALRNKSADYRWYAEIFYGMCADVGISAEVIKGCRVVDNEDVLAYWNRVNIGGTWYYTDMWYYFIEDYTEVEKMEYFLSEMLWINHKLEQY